MVADEQEGRNGKGRGAVSTFLVIPYFAGDRGRPGQERPLGSGTVYWLCPSIVVNGQPGKNTFKRGEPTSVTVDVANWGSGTAAAPVQVQLWWADPTTGFTKKTLFGQTIVVVPTGGGVRRSPPVVSVIPTSAPPHVCLLAYVSSPLDGVAPGSPVDPVGDRHWAQLNIAEVTAPAGQQFQLMVFVGNPFERAATFDVAARALDRERLQVLSRIRRSEVISLDRVKLQLSEGQRGEGDTLRLTLDPGRRRAVDLTGTLPDDVEPGLDIAFELVQSLPGEGREPLVTGAFGLILQRRRQS